ncbi:protein HESO1-like [Silene latifolia]|uniref:protein HESO1-like n=1 Tax=Silene latifolia TaxID=37657 RepID=UPI003D776645
MSTQHVLEGTLAEILRVINPSRTDFETRMRIIDELRDVVCSLENLKGATVEPFGSFLYQLFSRWGDLDISIELSNGSHILVPAKKHKQKLLGDVLRALRKTGSFRRLQFVSHARVPILKLESKFQNISCDISINNLSGHMKSKFLLWISLIDQRFRDMVLLVKEWAKANAINNPRDGTFNSYSLALLVIFHFQTCDPAILPPLKDLYPGNMADELIGVRADMERRIKDIADSNIARFRKERRPNFSSLSELFITFLGKFLDISTRTEEQGICTYSGQWENVFMNTRWLPKTHPIIIEDPFEQPENTARAVSRSQLTRIAEAFRNTYNLLSDPYQGRITLIPSLVAPEIINFFPGVPFLNLRADVRPYPWSNQNASHGNYSSSQFQHHFHKTLQVNQPKIFKGQNGKQPSLGQGPRERPGSQHQSVDRQKTGQQWPGEAQTVGPPNTRTLQHQRVDRQKTGQQWPGQAQTVGPPNTRTLQHQSVDRQRTGQQWQAQAQTVGPPNTRSLQPTRNDNWASQGSLKASPAAQAPQVWRQKQFER